MVLQIDRALPDPLVDRLLDCLQVDQRLVVDVELLGRLLRTVTTALPWLFPLALVFHGLHLDSLIELSFLRRSSSRLFLFRSVSEGIFKKPG